VVPHFSLPESVNEEEEKGEGEDGGHAASYQPKADVGRAAALFNLAVVA
jgi:hypothetical protein